jgi:serine/threonine protein kinase
MDPAQACPICGKGVAPDAPQGLCPQCLMKTGFDTRPQNESSKTPFVPPPVEDVAAVFPQLEIIGFLGQGGMGAVYKARQPALDRVVALKILPSASAQDPGFAERFNREARALARLNHPNIVTVYDFGQADDTPYFLMEYVEGSTLRQVAQSGRLTPRETLGVVVQICEALQFAHDQGIVHRDIKPENILLDSKGRVKIADFGIAKVLEPGRSDLSLTGARDVVGTAHYMAPEQFEHPQSVDHRADIFSLGVVFYELLTGELPLGKFAPPSEKAEGDARLDEVVLHTLEKEPDRRYQQASEVKTAIEGLADSPASEPPREPAQAARKRLWVAAAVLLLICVGGILAALFSREKTPVPTNLKPSAPLNLGQRLFMERSEAEFRKLLEEPVFPDSSEKDRAEQDQQLLAALKGPHSDQYWKAITALAYWRPPGAAQSLLAIATDQRARGNRDRWMAVRALGILGDKTVVPELIHLTYHFNADTRWWAQISLVRLTGTNFGADYQAWGRWWNQAGGQPPFDPERVRWTTDPQGSDLALQAQHDQLWLANLTNSARSMPPAVTAEAAPAGTPTTRPEPEGSGDDNHKPKPMQNLTPMNNTSASSGIGGLVFLAFCLIVTLALYLFFCFCCKRICEKTGHNPGILIWIPILQFIPLLQAAGMAAWMVVLMLIPLVNVIVGIMMWAKICAARGKSPWLVVLLFIPLIDLAFLPYLAFSE